MELSHAETPACRAPEGQSVLKMCVGRVPSAAPKLQDRTLGAKRHCAERIERLTLRTTGKPRRTWGAESEMKPDGVINSANIHVCQECPYTL